VSDRETAAGVVCPNQQRRTVSQLKDSRGRMQF